MLSNKEKTSPTQLLLPPSWKALLHPEFHSSSFVIDSCRRVGGVVVGVWLKLEHQQRTKYIHVSFPLREKDTGHLASPCRFFNLQL